MHNPTALCPCQSSQPYQSCCLPLHKQHKRPDTAEQLMRSRYSAFYLKLTDYLVQTLHPDFKKTDDVTALTRIFETTQWLGLKILNHSQSSLHSAQVEFVAFYQEHHTKEIQQLHENSRFSMIEHQWLYQDGEQLSAIKLARNEACFCGSGTKLKKCHSS